MAIGAASVEEVVNEALARIGSDHAIGNIREASREAQVALRVYAQTRDDILQERDWGFAERNTPLTLLKTAPVGGYVPPRVWTPASDPIPNWIYEYAYPADCIKIRSLRRTSPFPIPNFVPKPNVYRIANDTAYSPAQKVILCNLSGALLVYTGQVVDPTTWEPLFTETVIAALAERLAPALEMADQLDIEDTKVEAVDEVQEINTADTRRN